MSALEVLAAVAITLGLLLSAFNWTTILPRPGRKYVSPAPLAGGVLLAIGFLGFEATRPYWWLAALVDFGTLGLLLALPMIIGEIWAHSDRNTLYIFDAKADDRSVSVRLFKNGDCVIDISFDPPRPHGRHGQLAVSAGFVGKWHSYDHQFEVDEYACGRTLHILPGTENRYTLAENYPKGDEPSIYALDGIDVHARRLNAG